MFSGPKHLPGIAVAAILFLTVTFSVAAQQPYVPDDPVLPDYLRQVTLYCTDGSKTTLGTVLDSLAGRVVFIDFWASWCSPCLREMPYSKDLQKQVAGEEVTFLYLSTNTERSSWLKGMERINVPGHHYRIEPLEKNRFKKYFRIPGIPFYVILDKVGRVFLADAPWPHDKRCRKKIEEAGRLEIED
jgi:thiol-disulfide isomerase/thioredoxin